MSRLSYSKQIGNYHLFVKGVGILSSHISYKDGCDNTNCEKGCFVQLHKDLSSDFEQLSTESDVETYLGHFKEYLNAPDNHTRMYTPGPAQVMLDLKCELGISNNEFLSIWDSTSHIHGVDNKRHYIINALRHMKMERQNDIERSA